MTTSPRPWTTVAGEKAFTVGLWFGLLALMAAACAEARLAGWALTAGAVAFFLGSACALVEVVSEVRRERKFPR